MNKIIIPSILGIILLVAGIYAFVPIEEASTVHKTINSFVVPQVVVLATDNTVAANDNYELNCDAKFTLLGMNLDATGIGGNEDIDLDFSQTIGFAVNIISTIQDNLALVENGNDLLLGQGPIGASGGTDEFFQVRVNAGTYGGDTIGGQAYVITSGSCTFTE